MLCNYVWCSKLGISNSVLQRNLVINTKTETDVELVMNITNGYTENRENDGTDFEPTID